MALENARRQGTVTQQVTDDNFLTTSETKFPDNSGDFVQRYGSQNLTGYMALRGYIRPTHNKIFRHWEKDYIDALVTVKGTGTLARGIAIRVDPIDTTGTPYLTVNDVVRFAGSDVNGIVEASARVASDGSTLTNQEAIENTSTTVSAVTGQTAGEYIYYIRSVNGTTFTVADGASLAIISNEFAEGTDQSGATSTEPIEYINQTVIVKDTHTSTGTARTQKSWIWSDGSDSDYPEGWYWYLEDEGNTYTRFQNHVEFNMLLGQTITSAATELTAANLNGHEGVWDFVGNEALLTSGNFTVTGAASVLATTAKTLKVTRGHYKNTLMMGYDIKASFDDNMGEINSRYENGEFWGDFDNKGMNATGGEMGLALEFDWVKLHGFHFYTNSYAPFDYQANFGGLRVGSVDTWSGRAIMNPMDEMNDMYDGKPIPSIGIRYLQNESGYSRLIETWLVGGADGIYNNSRDEVQLNYRSERGFEGNAANRHFRFRRA